MSEERITLTAEDWLREAAETPDRKTWASNVYQAFQARQALIRTSGLLTDDEIAASAWKWIGTQLDRMEPPRWKR